MPHGGRRVGAGRKPGEAWKSKKINYRELDKARDHGELLPLPIMREATAYYYGKYLRLSAKGGTKSAEEALNQSALWAEKSAKYMHPTLQAVAVRSETATQYVARLPNPCKSLEECNQVVSLLKH